MAEIEGSGGGAIGKLWRKHGGGYYALLAVGTFVYLEVQSIIESIGEATAMREFQPDVLLCAGPGSSLRAPVGHCVVQEGWRGIRTRQALFVSDVVALA